jgi:hypothetical protein
VPRNIVQRADAPTRGRLSGTAELKSVWCRPGVGRGPLARRGQNRGVEVTFTGVRHQGILGREPASDTVLRRRHRGDLRPARGLGDAESVLLAG